MYLTFFYSMPTKILIILLSTTVLLSSCEDVSFDNFSLDNFSFDSFFGDGEKTPEELKADSLRQDSIKKFKADSLLNLKIKEAEVMDNQIPTINFRCFAPTKPEMDSIKKIFGVSDSARHILTTINRRDWGFIRAGDSVVVPDKLTLDPKVYSTLPKYYPQATSIPKIIIISNQYQCYGAYENGKLVRFAGVNTGTKSKPTFPGRYALNWKEKLRRSSLDTHWKLPYNWNFHLYAGNALHQFVRPGRPASHSCVRQSMADAKWLFDWGEGAKKDTNNKMVPLTGTPVIILDMFDYKRKSGGPWRDLKTNKDKVIELPEKPMEVEEALIPLSQIPPELRGGKSKNPRYKHAEDTLRARGILDSNWTLSTSINYNTRRKERARASARVAAKRRAAKAKAAAAAATPVAE